MFTYKTIAPGILEGRQELTYGDVTKYFQKLRHTYAGPCFLYESKDVSDVYGRLSIIGIDPTLKLTGKGNQFTVEILSERARPYFIELANSDQLVPMCSDFSCDTNTICGRISKLEQTIEEKDRSKQQNISQVIRILLQKNNVHHRCLMGLYGAFSYDFVRLFEHIETKLPENEINDFTLYLYDTFLFFDHLQEQAEIVTFRDSTQASEQVMQKLTNILTDELSTDDGTEYKVANTEFQIEQKQYEQMVHDAQELARQGELFEVVYANTIKADFTGDPFGLYLEYREQNPSPYLFYYDFGDEHLVGASPEMMIRVENNKVHLRPISGTAKRGQDPLADHENMVDLLNSPKERAELDMLTDLGRNDLSRVCKPGLEIRDYRFVEKYSRVMHTVSHVTGELRDDNIAFDALISSLNAGTLTGAPKVRAMQAIEDAESERRGYYGGSIGYLTFANELNTGIIIRTAHIRDQKLSFSAGATLLYDSDPSSEYQETINKAQAFLDTISQSKSLTEQS